MRRFQFTSAFAVALTAAQTLLLQGCIDDAPMGQLTEQPTEQPTEQVREVTPVELQGADQEELGQFFTWLEHKNPELNRKINLSLRSEQGRSWSFEQFQEQAVDGRSVRTLWDQYRIWNRRSACGSCADNEFCKTLIPEQCGRVNLGTARCVEKPDFCMTIVEPVCGCDNKTYVNECEANRAGFSIIARGDCDDVFGRGLRPPD